jgi:ABC-type branched-subunit amino acid transport system ATPase component
VLLVSSELSEILALSDRVLVMTGGRIVHETTPAATDERTLGLWMTGRATLIDSPLKLAQPDSLRRGGHDEAPRA